MVSSRARRDTLVSLGKRGALLLVALVMIAGSAHLVFRIASDEVGPTAGQTTQVTERVRYWEPGQGWNQELRDRTVRLQQAPSNLTYDVDAGDAASPRGRQFSLPIDAELRVLGEPGVRATFAPTPLLASPPETVYLAVPWAAPGPDPVGAIDRFDWMGTEEIDDTTLVRYNARHGSQAFLHDGQIWHRRVDRTALVDPVTGLVVDRSDHETLWTEPQPRLPVLFELQRDLGDREKVWEAHVTITPAETAALVDRAQAARADVMGAVLAKALPVLGAGEVLLWAALVRRPRRWLGS